jgi:hypothetical protein
MASRWFDRNDFSVIWADASQKHVHIELPCPHKHGLLSIVCVDPTHGITIGTRGRDCIFDTSSLEFHAKGDAFAFANDGHRTWFCVGRYCADWYK